MSTYQPFEGYQHDHCLFHIQLIQVLFSEIMNQKTVTATNNYDYVLYVSHVSCMLLRLLRGQVLHHSIE
jgi:hypothetical protein